mmetsp:Transcript_1194/g.1199  ORF Transcript_1194/g.1199 Transcript_1194/m.1199 type:complete len:206 (+) Transcript_1194:65-682(+)
MSEDKPRGILRNKSVSESSESKADRLDRQEVIRNTRLNAQLASESSKGDKIRAKIAEAKAHQNNEDDNDSHEEKLGGDHLQWDEVNLYKTEQEKCATMRIDEPKTPYDGGFNPEGEYYNDDDEEIPNFELGSGEYDNIEDKGSSLNGGKVIKDPLYEEEPEKEEEPEETAEEKHKRFEEMRKQHYHLKGNALKQKIEISDDEDDE